MKGQREQLITTLASVIGVLFALAASLASAIPGLVSMTQLPFLLIGAFSAGAAAIASVYMTRQLSARAAAKRVFIVYSHKDMEVALRVSGLLKEHGFEPWIDVEQLLPGQMWKAEIDRALASSGTAIALISKHLLASESAQRELDVVLKQYRTASARAVPVIPVRLDDTNPPAELADIQWLDLRAPAAELQLLEGLKYVMKENGYQNSRRHQDRPT